VNIFEAALRRLVWPSSLGANLHKALELTMQHHAGQYYHVYNRGVNHQPIFTSEENYYFLLRQITVSASNRSTLLLFTDAQSLSFSN
jgi:hypothetical protein